jgi:hypothetical protein
LSIVSINVSPKTKKEMKQVSRKVEWPSEIRLFIEKRLERAKREEGLERVEQILKKMPSVPKGTAAKLVREDRDRDH